jgi:hypothetical protein
MIRAALTSVVVLLLATAASAATVSGTVLNAATHQPLGGMVVAAYDVTGTLRATGTTDITGFYALTLPAGSYRVLAYDNSGVYATTFDGNAESFETSSLRQLSESSAIQISFLLVRGGSVSGRVQSLTGGARPGATIEAYNLSGTRRGFTTADATGNYTIVLPPGDYKLLAYDSNGALAHSFFGDVRAFAQATEVHVTAGQTTTNISFSLPVASRITGTTVDGASQALLSGITVYAYTPEGALVTSTTTDAAGAFRLTLPPGAYRFVAADENRVYATMFYTASKSFEQATIVALAAGEVRPNVTFALPRAALLTGQVTASVTMTVSAYNLDGTLHAQTTTSSSGAYTLAVAAGEYKVAVSGASLHYATEFYRDAFAFASATRLFVLAGEQRRGIDFSPVVGGRITGTVRDAAQSLPRAGMTVAAYDAAGILVGTTVTRADGKYDLVLPPGQYRVVAFDAQLIYAPRYRGGAASYEQTIPLEIAASVTSTVDFTLVRGVRISGTVTDRNGKGWNGVEVFALDLAGNRIAGGTSVDGAFALAVPAGNYKFVVRDPVSGATRYYADAATLQDATVVTVALDQPAPRLSLTLPRSSRQRAVRH